MDKRAVFAIIAIIQLFAAFNAMDVRWDEAVYIMNSKYFSGHDTYIELIRPPILPLLLMPFNWSLIAMRLAYAVMGFMVCYLSYLILKHMDKEEQGKIAALLVSTNSLFFYWSHWIYSEIPATMFCLASILFFMRFKKNSSTQELLLCFFLASLAFLTKYTLGLLLPVLLLLLFLEKKLDWRVMLGVIIFILPLVPWLFYNWLLANNWFYTFEWGVFWPGSLTSDFWLYITGIPAIFTAQTFLLPLAFLKKRKKHLDLILFPILFFLFHQVFSYKETRYLLPIIPFVLILASMEIKKEWKKFLAPIMIIGLVFGGIYALPNIVCGRDAFSKIGRLEGRVLSVAWPLNAYYSDVSVKAFPENPQEFAGFVSEFNITYIITSNAYGWPEYAKSQEFFGDYELYKQVNDSCKTVWVYSVQKT